MRPIYTSLRGNTKMFKEILWYSMKYKQLGSMLHWFISLKHYLICFLTEVLRSSEKLRYISINRIGQDRTKLTFKLDFPGNLWLAVLQCFVFWCFQNIRNYLWQITIDEREWAKKGLRVSKVLYKLSWRKTNQLYRLIFLQLKVASYITNR